MPSPSKSLGCIYLLCTYSFHVQGLRYRVYLMASYVDTRFFNVYPRPFSTSLFFSALFMTGSSNLHSRPSSQAFLT